MKEKKLEKAEMKESILTGEALALNDAELESAAGGISPRFEAAMERLEKLEDPAAIVSGGGTAAEISVDEFFSKIDPSIFEKMEEFRSIYGIKDNASYHDHMNPPALVEVNRGL